MRKSTLIFRKWYFFKLSIYNDLQKALVKGCVNMELLKDCEERLHFIENIQKTTDIMKLFRLEAKKGFKGLTTKGIYYYYQLTGVEILMGELIDNF